MPRRPDCCYRPSVLTLARQPLLPRRRGSDPYGAAPGPDPRRTLESRGFLVRGKYARASLRHTRSKRSSICILGRQLDAGRGPANHRIQAHPAHTLGVMIQRLSDMTDCAGGRLRRQYITNVMPLSLSATQSRASITRFIQSDRATQRGVKLGK